jgi:hypothetical protein
MTPRHNDFGSDGDAPQRLRSFQGDGDPGGTPTRDNQISNLALYATELPGHHL